MPRLPIALSFLAGLAVASLLGMAAPRGRPVKWEYRTIDWDARNKVEQAAVEARVASTRSKFASDAEARSAASDDIERAWFDELAGDGWLLLGRMRGGNRGRVYLLGRPSSGFFASVAKEGSDSVVAGVREALEKHRAAWIEKVKRESPTSLGARDPRYLGSDYDRERKELLDSAFDERLKRCGERGTLILPLGEDRGPLDQFFAASISSD